MGAEKARKGAKMTETRILTSHAIFDELVLERFQTRFGYVVWMIAKPSLPGHGGLFQGTRRDAIAWLRLHREERRAKARAAQARAARLFGNKDEAR